MAFMEAKVKLKLADSLQSDGSRKDVVHAWSRISATSVLESVYI